MNDAASNIDPRTEEILLRFEEELKGSSDGDAVVERYCRDHPELADELRGLAEIIKQLVGAAPGEVTSGDGAPPCCNGGANPARLGPYKVLGKIGQGGMGIVHRALEETLGLQVAVKTIHRNKAQRASMLMRFNRERKLLAKLHHTNIVPIFATGQEGDLLYFAMQYIDGVSLDQVIAIARAHQSNGGFKPESSIEHLVNEAHSKAKAQRAPGETTDAASSVSAPTPPIEGRTACSTRTLPASCISTAARCIATIAEAVHYAHEAGIIHRNIKPANIMVDRAGRAWAVDFGLARFKPDRQAAATSKALADSPPATGTRRHRICRAVGLAAVHGP